MALIRPFRERTTGQKRSPSGVVTRRRAHRFVLARVWLEKNPERVSVEYDLLFFLKKLYLDVSFCRRPHSRALGKTYREHALLVVPIKGHAHPIAFSVVERATIIFVEEKRTVATGINVNRERLVDWFIDILLHGSKWEYRSGSNVNRDGFEIN